VSRHFHQPRVVEISPGAGGEPAWLRWRGRRERVWVCNTWRVEGAWWRGEQAGRAYYTLRTASQVIIVVFRDEAVGRWFVEKVVD
jgi:hypothetical protein